MREHNVFIFNSGMAKYKQKISIENEKKKLTKRCKIPLGTIMTTMYVYKNGDYVCLISIGKVKDAFIHSYCQGRI